jgi:hypothetical protein
MLPGSSDDSIPPIYDNPNDMAIRPGYVARPGDDKTYLVPTVLPEGDRRLASMEMPDLSKIWDKEPGVSFSV